MDRTFKEERNYVLNIVKKIKASGCNVLLIQKSILRDAVNELSLHYLAKVANPPSPLPPSPFPLPSHYPPSCFPSKASTHRRGADEAGRGRGNP